MCKPVIWSAVHRAQDGTVLSRSVGLDDGRKVKTVKTERLVSPEYRRNHTKNCALLIEAAYQQEDG